MEKIEKINEKELTHLVRTLETVKRRFLKFIGIVSVLVCFPLFVPISILRFFKRVRFDYTSEFLFVELGPQNVMYFIFIPVIIILILSYFFLFRIPKIKKDIVQKEKIVGMVKVKEIAKLDDETIKTIMGLSDYKVVFEANDFEEKETMFLSKKNPEYLHAKFCKVEVSKNAKIPLKREVIYE
jgi:hypothetical protein